MARQSAYDTNILLHKSSFGGGSPKICRVDVMGANMKCEKNSLALLSSKRTKAYTRTRADEAFALPSFSDAMPIFTTELPPPRSPKIARPEHHPEHDVEKLKQTMLQHESTFKEQLYELHRLYQVQRLLMAESKRKGPASHPHSDSPSSTSSLLYNPDSFKSRGDKGLWDANDGRNQRQNFFPSQIDMNKPHGAMNHAEQLANAKSLKEGRLTFDLERPAEEYMDIEVEEKKSLVRETFPETTCKSNVSYVSRPALHPSRVSEENTDVSICAGYNMEKIDGMHRETLGSNGKIFEENWLPDCFTLERSGHKEVPFFPFGPSRSVDCSFQEALLRPAQSSASSIFGGLPSLNHELSYAEKGVLGVQKNLEEKRKEIQFFDFEGGQRSTEGTSKLPHWLLQGSPAASTKTLPGNPIAHTSGTQHQSLPFFLQKHDERKLGLVSGERIDSTALQDLSNPWSNSGTSLQQGQPFSRGSPSKPSSGPFPSATAGIAQGFHKMAQAGGIMNERIPLPSYVRGDKGAGLLPTGYPSPATDIQTPLFETHAAPTVFLPGLSSRGTTKAATVLPWYQQKGFSSFMQQESNPGSLYQRSSYGSPVNPLGALVAGPNHEVQPAISMRSANDPEGSIHGILKADDSANDSKGLSPPLMLQPEVPAQRSIFGFMPTMSDLELTLGFSMKRNDTLGTQERVKESSFSGQVVQRHDNFDGLKLMKNSIDLNAQRGQGQVEKNFDACCTAESRINAIHKVLKQEQETVINPEWHVATGMKVPYQDERQTVQTSLSQKGVGFVDNTGKELFSSEVAAPKAVAQLQNNSVLFPKADMLRNDSRPECFYGGSDPGGGPFVGGKSSDGSGLTSCESREAVTLALTKARDDSNTSSGEACQSRELKISVQNEVAAFSSNVHSKRSAGNLFGEASMVGSQQPQPVMFPAMLSSSGLSQHDTTKDCVIADCTYFNDSEVVDNSARKHVTEADKAAEVLLSLGFDLPSLVIEDPVVDDQERSLKWLADIIPQEDNCEIIGMDIGLTGMAVREGALGSSQLALENGGGQDKIPDSFELAVLMLKPINPDTEKLSIRIIDRCNPAEKCPPLPNLRRRSLRRGRVGKDFQREMLPSIASLSRQEITEDLQIIEGLIKSATEAMAKCSLSPKEEVPLPMPEAASMKNSGKTKVAKSCKIGKHSGLLRVCSWGESTRRKRMRRQRSQWLCLPPGV